MLQICIIQEAFGQHKIDTNKLAKLQATLVRNRNYDSLTDWLTGVKCRATNVAKKQLKHMMSTRFGTNIDMIRMVAKALYFLNHSLSLFMSNNQLLLNQWMPSKWMPSKGQPSHCIGTKSLCSPFLTFSNQYRNLTYEFHYLLQPRSPWLSICNWPSAVWPKLNFAFRTMGPGLL